MTMRLLQNARVSPAQLSVADADADTAAAESCANLLLRALADSASDVALLRAGETPYMQGPGGEIDLARHSLTPAAMETLAGYFLPRGAVRNLEENATIRV